MKLFAPRTNSNTQLTKERYAKANPPTYVKCAKCGLSITTLRKLGDIYLCPKCHDKAKKMHEPVENYLRKRGVR